MADVKGETEATNAAASQDLNEASETSREKATGSGARDQEYRTTGQKWRVPLIAAGLILAVAGLVWVVFPSAYTNLAAWLSGGGEDDGGGPPVVTVTYTEVGAEDWESRLESVGTVSARQGIDVTSEVAGKVATIWFEPGQRVRRGDRLLDLESTRETAALAAAQARLEEARRDERRDSELLERTVISEELAEDSTFTVARIQAEVNEAQAVVGLKSVRAPFDGTLGIRQVDLGQFVEAGDRIVSLQRLSEVFVEFNVPEEQIGKVAVGQTLSATFAAYPSRTFEGMITTLDPAVSTTSRSLAVQAEIDNFDRALLPGMFADIELDLGDVRTVLLVPQTAIAFNAYGASVFLVAEAEASSPEEDEGGGSAPGAAQADEAADGSEGPQLIARRAFVELGERRDGLIEIASGLEAGDRVVTGGQINLGDGSPIELSDREPLSEIDARPGTPGLDGGAGE
ncbi:MAG: efflux RND transporter periplasmic adaptor subunit [Pseudomonadota bacterium]